MTPAVDRTVAAFKSLAFQRYGSCGTCEAKGWVARSSARHPFRCADCVAKRLERRKPI